MIPPSLETRIQQLEHAVVAFARVELGDSGPKPDEDRDSHGEWTGGGGGGGSSVFDNPAVSSALGKTSVGDTATVHVNDSKNPNAAGGGAPVTGTVTAVDKNGVTIKGADGKETHIPSSQINNLHSSGSDGPPKPFGKVPKKTAAKKGGGKGKKAGGGGKGKKGGGGKGAGAKKAAGPVAKAKAPSKPTQAQIKLWNDTVAANAAKKAAGKK